MLQFFKRLFVPTRFDACCFVVAGHWLVALFCVAVLPSISTGRSFANSDPIIVTAGATWVAIAATLCWKANSARRTWLLAISSVASVCFVVGWYFLNADVVDAKGSLFTGRQVSQMPSFDLSRFLENARSHSGFALLIACLVWLINITLRKMIRFTSRPLAGLVDRFRGNRTGVLIGIAAVMFVLAILSRIVSSSGGGMSIFGPMVDFRIAMGGYVLTCLVTLFWFARSFVLIGRPVQKVFSFLMVFVLMLPYTVDAISGVNFDENVAYALSGILFVLSVVGLGGCETAVGAATVPAAKRVSSRPSVFAVVPIVLLTVAALFQSFFDVSVLAVAPRKASSFSQLIGNARESAIVKWESGGRIQFLSDPSPGGSVWRVQFDEKAPKDLLNVLQNHTGGRGIELCDMTPDFDTSMLSGSGTSLALTDCEVSHSQLSNIIKSSSWMTVRGKFSFVDDGTTVDPGVVNSIQFENVEPGVIRRFFDVAKCEDQMTYFIVHSPVGNEDWAAVEEVAQTGQVYLYGGWTEDFQLPIKPRSLRRVHFHDLTAPAGQPKSVDKRLILNTDMKFTFGGAAALDPEFVWKLMLLRGDFSGYLLTHYWENSGQPLDEFSKDLGLSYQLNADQTIHSLYLPWCSEIADFSDLSEIRVLSFDPAWVQSGSVIFGRGSITSLIPFKTLTSLEELYFEPSFIPEDLSVLADLTSLKHLQIPSVVRKVTGPVGFDACQSLESITFFGKPDDTTYREISQLKKLKRLVIVNNENDDSLTDDYLGKIRSKFPGVEAKIILPTETDSLIPQAFRDYRDRARKDLRTDTSWLDELVK